MTYRYTTSDGIAYDYTTSGEACAAYAAANVGKPSAQWAGSVKAIEQAQAQAPAESNEQRESRRNQSLEASDDDQWAKLQVNELDAASAKADADALSQLGLKPGSTIYAPGHVLNRWGLDAWQSERQAAEDAPSLREQAEAIAEQVRDEHRTDRETPVSDLRFDVVDGELRLYRASRGPQGGGLRIERNGLAALIAKSGRILPNWGYTHTLTANELAELWNSRVGRAADLNADNEVMIRARNGVGPWSVYAVVSPKYGAYDIDKVCDQLATHAGDFRGLMAYDYDRVRLHIEAVDVRPQTPVVGEVWKVGFTGSTADDGTGAFNLGGSFWRAVCRNLTSAQLDTAKLRRIHRGNVTTLDAQISAVIQLSQEAFAPFRDKWELLSETPATTVLGGASLREAIANLVDGDAALRIAAAGIKRDALVEGLLANVVAGAEDTDDVLSLAAVVNAVTRYHTQRVPVTVTRSLEDHAGILVNRFADAASHMA